jgi:phosphoesterase RecJ-like protein
MIFESLRECIKNYNQILIIPHVNPDGDCIGSAVGLANILRKLSKDVVIGTQDEFPKKFGFLLKDIPIINTDNGISLVISVDCSNYDRLALPLKTRRDRVLINIDHHITNDLYGDINFVDPKAAATGEILYDLLDFLEIPMDESISYSLYTAIMTDTGSFKYSNTTPKTLRIASSLVSNGVIPELIYKEVYAKSKDSIGLLVEALKNISYFDNGKIVWSYIDHKKILSLKVEGEDFESIVNLMREIEGIELAYFFKEMEENIVKISFRSTGQIDVSELASLYRGGGHPKASGCTINGDIHWVIFDVNNYIKENYCGK